jgi:deoxyribodipyrimidine photo-lyase
VKLAIHWFRRDLRLADNPALLASLESADRVLPVYIWSPEEDGAWAPGGATRWWLQKSLAALDAALRARGSRLLLRTGPAAATLAALAVETGATRVHWNRVYEPVPTGLDAQVTARLESAGIETFSFKAALLFEPRSLATATGGAYRVFTPFWKAALGQPGPYRPLPPPDELTAPACWPAGLELEQLGLAQNENWTAGLAEAWIPGEEAALARLDAWCDDGLGSYADGRDRPDRGLTSALSPYLHHGELSPRQAWHAASAREPVVGQRGVEAWRRQLGWREFAHHVLHHFQHTPTEPMHARYATFPWRENFEPMLAAWQRGETGFPIVDAGMRQLWATGWMHNRVRMIAASLLVKNIRAPWQAGARWFWDTLVDADLANNTMGWQWSAGCGADAAPYFRIFNPVTQGEKFDPRGDYVKRWVPELSALPAELVHRPWQHPNAGYPPPILDLKRSREEALAAYASLRGS